jgi:hypothetical protein
MARAGIPIVVDLPCRQCGYNLRGLNELGSCPECGSAAADSLRGDSLRFAAPKYLAVLVQGAKLIWWSIAVVLLAIICVVCAVMYSYAGGRLGQAAGDALGFALLASSLLSLMGWWLLSTPDPAARDGGRGRVSRAILRGSLVVSTLGFVATLVARLPSTSRAASSGTLSNMQVLLLYQVPMLANGAVIIAWIVGFYASMVYVRALAERIPDHVLARRANILLWSLVTIVGFWFVAFVSTFLFQGSMGSMIPGCAALVVTLVFVVIYIHLIDRLKTSLFKLQVEQAGPATTP